MCVCSGGGGGSVRGVCSGGGLSASGGSAGGGVVSQHALRQTTSRVDRHTPVKT